MKFIAKQIASHCQIIAPANTLVLRHILLHLVDHIPILLCDFLLWDPIIRYNLHIIMNPDESRSSYISYEHISKSLHNGRTSALARGQGLLHSVEEQTWRVPLLVSWSAEDASGGAGGAGYGVTEKAQAVLEEFQQRPEMLRNDPTHSNTLLAKMYYTYITYLHVCIQVNVNVWYTFIDLNTDIFFALGCCQQLCWYLWLRSGASFMPCHACVVAVRNSSTMGG